MSASDQYMKGWCDAQSAAGVRWMKLNVELAATKAKLDSEMKENRRIKDELLAKLEEAEKEVAKLNSDIHLLTKVDKNTIVRVQEPLLYKGRSYKIMSNQLSDQIHRAKTLAKLVLENK